MISIKLSKVVEKVANRPLCSGVIAVQNGPKAHTFTLILAIFASQPRWRNKSPKKSIGSRFIKILNKNDQSSEETLTVEPERLLVFYPHPYGRLPLSTYIRATSSGENPWEPD